MELTFANVKKNSYDLVYKIDENVGKRYEELTSFNRGRDFNSEVKSYIEGFVQKFDEFLTEENEEALNERLVKYNKLVVELRTNILSATKIPSMLLTGGSNYPAARKRKENDRVHEIESELYSEIGRHARFIANTESMFDPIAIEMREGVERMRKQRSEKNGWLSFCEEVTHDELTSFGIDAEASRVYITTAGKPSDETRSFLKQGAFKWSPKNGRWQRVLTKNALYSTVNVLSQIGIETTLEKFVS